MHPALLKRSGFTWGWRFNELEAAQRWGCPSPDHYDRLPRSAKLDILAWHEARWRVDAVSAHEAMKEKPRRKAKR